MDRERDFLSTTERLGPTAVGIGVFDGVHQGHRKLALTVVEHARARSLQPVALTFDPHPQEVLSGKPMPRLTELADRRAMLLAAGVERVIVIRFTPELSRCSPLSFVQDVLQDRLGAREIVVGFNFKFGVGGSGNARTLIEAGQQASQAAGYQAGYQAGHPTGYQAGHPVDQRTDPAARPGADHRPGFTVTTLGPVEIEGQPVSSSAIRTALTEGDVSRANLLLGRPYHIAGVVGPGSGRGRQLGFPTANVTPPEGLLVPKRGVYRGLATICDDGAAGGSAGSAAGSAAGGPTGGAAGRIAYPALINIGRRPTFEPEGSPQLIEVYLHGFEGDLSGRRLKVEFEERLRDEQKFASVESLLAQIRRDLASLLSRIPGDRRTVTP